MKKNAVGHVLAQKESSRKRFSLLRLPARILCLVLAIIIWLAIVNLNSLTEDEATASPTDTTIEESTI